MVGKRARPDFAEALRLIEQAIALLPDGADEDADRLREVLELTAEAFALRERTKKPGPNVEWFPLRREALRKARQVL